MTMERFMLDGFQDESLYAELASSNVFPLVRELEFKHGLKVLRKTQSRVTSPTGYRSQTDSWLMSRKDGIAVCKVFTTQFGGKDKDRLEFCYRSPFYSKERGGSSEDKQTITSVKVSALMSTITRHNVMPSAEKMIAGKIQQVRNAVGLLRKALGSSEKSSPFTTHELHALLAMALRVSPTSDRVAVDLTKCKNTLDLFEAADRLTEQKLEESIRVFKNPFFMVGVDELGDYLIGRFKIIKFGDSSNDLEYETIQPFKRYRSYEEVTDLIPVMTMVKLAYEGTDTSKAGVMPIRDLYDPNLDAAFFYNTQPTHYDHLFMVTPCPI